MLDLVQCPGFTNDVLYPSEQHVGMTPLGSHRNPGGEPPSTEISADGDLIAACRSFAIIVLAIGVYDRIL